MNKRKLLKLQVVNSYPSLWTGGSITIHGGQLECELYLHVVDGDGPVLMGRDWIKTLEFDEINSVEVSKSLHEVLEKHSSVLWDI